MTSKNFGNILKQSTNKSAGDELKKLESSVKGFEKVIPWGEMRSSEDNKYEIETNKVNEIKESLKRFGFLFYNLIVIPIDEEDYKYKILAGATRHCAIGELLEEGNTLFAAGIRCIVIDRNTTIVDQKIIIEETNLIQRDYDQKTKAEAIKRLRDLYKEKNEAENTNVSVTKQIATQTGIGERQVQKYLSTDKLIPELKQLFDASVVSLEKISQFSNMNEADQRIVLDLFNQKNDADKKEVELIKAEMQKKEEIYLNKINSLELKVESVEKENTELNESIAKKDILLSQTEMKEEALRKEIAEEINTASPDKKKIAQMEEEAESLGIARIKIESERDSLKTKLDLAEKKLKNLEVEVTKEKNEVKEKGNIKLLPEEKDKLKQEFELENILEQLNKNIAQFAVKGEAYIKKYNSDVISDYYINIFKRLEIDRKKLLKGEK